MRVCPEATKICDVLSATSETLKVEEANEIHYRSGPSPKLYCGLLPVIVVPFVTASAVLQEKESKTQPKEMVLAKDSQSDKYEEVAFNHENHSTKKYSVTDRVCFLFECHHTDQPAAGLKPPQKSERNVILTAAVLQPPMRKR